MSVDALLRPETGATDTNDLGDEIPEMMASLVDQGGEASTMITTEALTTNVSCIMQYCNCVMTLLKWETAHYWRSLPLPTQQGYLWCWKKFQRWMCLQLQASDRE